MKPEIIQLVLRRAGITQRDIARRLGVSEVSVHKEIYGIATSERIREAVAEAMGQDKERVFADYYMSPAIRRRQRQASA